MLGDKDTHNMDPNTSQKIYNKQQYGLHITRKTQIAHLACSLHRHMSPNTEGSRTEHSTTLKLDKKKNTKKEKRNQQGATVEFLLASLSVNWARLKNSCPARV